MLLFKKMEYNTLKKLRGDVSEKNKTFFKNKLSFKSKKYILVMSFLNIKNIFGIVGCLEEIILVALYYRRLINICLFYKVHRF